MKKIILLLTVFALAACNVHAADGVNVIVNENFNTVSSVPAGFRATTTGKSEVKVVARDDNPADKYLRIVDSSVKNNEGVELELPDVTGKVTVKFDILKSSESTKDIISFFALDSNNRQAIALNFDMDLLYGTQYGMDSGIASVSTKYVNGGLSKDTWYTFAIEADFPSKTYNLYLDGTMIAEAAPFRLSNVINIAKIHFAGGYWSDGLEYNRVFFLDNVSAVEGTYADLPNEGGVVVDPPVYLENRSESVNVFADDFQMHDAGKPPKLYGLYENGDGSVSIAQDERHDKALAFVSGQDGAELYTAKAFPSQNNSVTMEFDAIAASGNIKLSLLQGENTGKPIMTLELGANGAGAVTKSGYTPLGSLEAGKRERITVSLYIGGYYSVFINNTLVGENLPIDNFMSSVNQFSFSTDSANCDVKIDNIEIFPGLLQNPAAGNNTSGATDEGIVVLQIGNPKAFFGGTIDYLEGPVSNGAPILSDGTTMVSVNGLVKLLGAKLDFDGIPILELGEKSLPVSSVVVEGNSYVPIRQVCTELGYDVLWTANRCVVLSPADKNISPENLLSAEKNLIGGGIS